MDVVNCLTTVNFGAGAATTLPQAMSEAGLSRPLTVSDAGFVAVSILDRAEFSSLSDLPRFLDVPTNPTESAVMAGLDVYRRAKCDGVIAIGGGSPIDLAKGIASLATHEGFLEQYAAILGGVARITPNVAPMIAIQTTAGTGSEVGHAALSQCVEIYLSPRYNHPAEAIACADFGRIWRALPVAIRERTSIAARSDLMMGALEDGMTFQKGLGAIHALSHALGGLKDLKLHHSLLNAILLPEVIHWNRELPEAAKKLNHLERLAGIAEGSTPEELEKLNQTLGISTKLSDLDVPRDIIGWICERALADHSHRTNPRPCAPPTTQRSFEAVY